MKKLAITLATLAILACLGYWYRLELLIAVLPIVDDIREPIGAHRAVAWRDGPASATTPPLERPPNIVVILADDLGFNDISFTNGGAADGTLQTPNIDSIARNGVAFSNGYAANAVCAPSRAAIMTGRYSTRFGFEYTPFPRVGVTIFQWMADANPGLLPVTIHHDLAEALPPMHELGMPTSEVTIAEVLKAGGYQTAHIGKWHLGGAVGSQPIDQGFDDSLNMASGLYLPKDSPDVVNAELPFSSIDKMVWASMRYAATFNGGELFEPKGYLTDYYTDEALRVIDANRNRPFFLYLSHWGVHNPLQASREDYDALSHIEDHALRVYAGMIRALDRSVGRVLAALREHGLEENTLVIFTSDNGGAGYLGLPDINKPYRGWKLTLFEGGIHVPFFMQWPAKIDPGTVFDHPVGHIDIFATAAAAGNVALPTDRVVDGVDLLPHVIGQTPTPPHETLFWREGHHQVVLHDGWKLVVSKRAPGHETPAGEEANQRWLFDMRDDPTERRNVARRMPERVTELQALLDEHNAAQAEPMWPSIVDSPQLIDKTEAEAYVEGDEYIYWPN